MEFALLLLALLCQAAEDQSGIPLELQGIWKTTQISSFTIRDGTKTAESTSKCTGRSYVICPDAMVDIYNNRDIRGCVDVGTLKWRAMATDEGKYYFWCGNKDMQPGRRRRYSIQLTEPKKAQLSFEILCDDGTKSVSKYSLERESNQVVLTAFAKLGAKRNRLGELGFSSIDSLSPMTERKEKR